MKKSIIRISWLSLLCLAIGGPSAPLFAQSTTKTSAEKAASQTGATNTVKSARGGPFHGKLVSVDKVAKTIVVGKRTFQITSETKIKKGGKPATLDDGVVGEVVSGYIKPGSDDKLIATSVNFGPKAPPPNADQPKSTAEKDKQPK